LWFRLITILRDGSFKRVSLAVPGSEKGGKKNYDGGLVGKINKVGTELAPAKSWRHEYGRSGKTRSTTTPAPTQPPTIDFQKSLDTA
jgi:hypothetical protein